LKTNLKPSEEMVWTKWHPKSAESMVYPNIPVYDLIKEESGKRKDNVAIEYNGTEIKYGQFFDRVDEISETIRTKFDPYSIVTIPTIPTPDLVALFYALSDNRVISDMIDPRTSLAGMKKYLENYKKSEETAYLFTLDLINEKMNPLIGDSSVEQIVNMSLADHATKMPLKYKLASMKGRADRIKKYPKNVTFDEFVNAKGDKNNPKVTEYDRKTPLTIMHTGGTTGDPKGVLLSHYGLNATSWNIIHSGADVQPKDKFLHYMPLFIAYGLIMVHVSLIRGMRICMISPFEPNKFDKLLFQHRAQHFAGVPSHIAKLKGSKLVKKHGLSFLKTPTVGGDGIDAATHQDFSEFVLANGSQNGICPGYSLTEANSTGTINLGQLNKYGSPGYPLPGIRMGVFDEKNNELGYNEIGEICINTPSVMLGYHNNLEATEAILKKHEDGNIWIHTGDKGQIDEDGFIHVIGRIKNMIIRHDGFNVYPKVIEEAIVTHPAVETCVVVGIADKKYSQGQLPKAHIILKKGIKEESQILQEIKAICSETLPEHFQVAEFTFREEYPMTLIGKVDRIALQNEEKELAKDNPKLTKSRK